MSGMGDFDDTGDNLMDIAEDGAITEGEEAEEDEAYEGDEGDEGDDQAGGEAGADDDDDDAGAFDSDDDDKDEHNGPSAAQILHWLKGLPRFPDMSPADAEPVTATAAFAIATGPCTLIREVMLPPFRHEEAPAAIYELIEEARVCHNAGQYDGAVRRLADAYAQWQDKANWREVDHEAIRLKQEGKERRRDERVAAERARQQAEEDEREAERERDLEQRTKYDSDDEGMRETRMARYMAEREAKDKAEEGDRLVKEAEDAARLEALAELSDDDEESEDEIEVSVYDEMQFQVFVWNTLGSVYESQFEDAKALVTYWQAKQAWDAQDDDEEEEEGSLVPQPGGDPDGRGPVRELKPFMRASPASGLTFFNLGSAALHLGQPQTALDCFYAALNIRYQCVDKDSYEFVDVGSALNNIGVCLHALDRHREALRYFESANELMAAILDPIHPRLHVVRNNLEKVRPRTKSLGLDTMSTLRYVIPKVTDEEREEMAKKNRGRPVEEEEFVPPSKLRSFRVTMTPLTKLVDAANKRKGGKRRKRKAKS